MKDKKFWEEYEIALNKSSELTKDRIPSYVGDESILDFWINGDQDLVYEINKKCLRLKRQYKNDSSNSSDSIEDTIIDLINYSAFLYALRECNKIYEK